MLSESEINAVTISREWKDPEQQTGFGAGKLGITQIASLIIGFLIYKDLYL